MPDSNSTQNPPATERLPIDQPATDAPKQLPKRQIILSVAIVFVLGATVLGAFILYTTTVVKTGSQRNSLPSQKSSTSDRLNTDAVVADNATQSASFVDTNQQFCFDEQTAIDCTQAPHGITRDLDTRADHSDSHYPTLD